MIEIGPNLMQAIELAGFFIFCVVALWLLVR